MQITNKENLIHYMQSGKLQLSNIDMNFLQNLGYNHLMDKPLTTNQLNLLDKIIEKYKKQFKKQGLDYQKLLQLPYNGKIIESDEDHTSACISIEDNKLVFSAPFNKKFIQNLQILSYTPFVWDKQKRKYVSDFSTYALKTIYDLAKKHYSKLKYSYEIEKLLEIEKNYSECKFWKPTYVKVNNNCFILSINENLHEHLREIKLDDSLETLSILAEHAVEIDISVTQNKDSLIFAGNFFNTIDSREIDNFITYLQDLNCDCIYFTNRLDITSSLKDLKNRLSSVTKNLLSINDKHNNKVFNYPVLIHFGSVITHEKLEKHKIKKVIKIKNSNEISIR